MAGTNLPPIHLRHKRLALVATVLVLLISACDSSTSGEPPIAGATGNQVVTDLSNDALFAPTPPILEIAIHPGELNFTWNNVITATRTSLYAYDTITRNEWLVSDAISAEDTQFNVATVSHELPWHSRQYRIELCDVDDCVSSLRVGLSGRAIDSIQTLTPAVSLSGEEFGQSVAINDNGRVAAIAEPLAGSVTISTRNNNDWSLSSSIDISDVISSTRKLDIAMSTDGDTIAVLSNETDVRENNDNANINSITKPRLLILERLGESWFITKELDISALTGTRSDTNGASGENTEESVTLDETGLYLSANGKRVLLSTPESLILFTELAGSWQPSILVNALPSQRLATSLGVSSSLDRIHFASIDVAGVSIQGLQIIANESLVTQLYSLPQVTPTSDIQLASSASGDKLVVLAWENRGDSRLIPVAWQFQSRIEGITDDNATAMPVLQLDIERSGRFKQASDNATLQLAANHDLSTIIFAWQSLAGSDAALTSVIAENNANDSRQAWQHALELPQSAPGFAKSAFVGHLALSHDGRVLMISVPREHGRALSEALDTININTGQILVLQ